LFIDGFSTKQVSEDKNPPFQRKNKETAAGKAFICQFLGTG